MKNPLLAVVLGYLVWTIIWLGANQFLFADAAAKVESGQALNDMGALFSQLALSVVCSICSGLMLRAMATGNRKAWVVLSGLLVATGISVQGSVWTLMPVWYHLAFLILLAPGVRVGSGKLE
jgi:hypothetical protein